MRAFWPAMPVALKCLVKFIDKVGSNSGPWAREVMSTCMTVCISPNIIVYLERKCS